LTGHDWERICELYFELSNETRINILRILNGGPLNLTNLSKELGVTTQECSRHLSRLVEAKLLEKTPDGHYRVSPYGELMIRTTRGQSFIVEHRDYFSTHTLGALPDEFVGRIGELSKCEYIEDVMVVFQNIERMFREAEEQAMRITDQYLLLAVPASKASTERGVKFRIITIKDIAYPPDFTETTASFEKWLQEGRFTPREADRIDVFLAMSERAVAALSFPGRDGRFDYLGFTSRDEAALKWCRDLFEYYWERAEPKLDFPWT
jgi:predicted transcriptional regulator